MAAFPTVDAVPSEDARREHAYLALAAAAVGTCLSMALNGGLPSIGSPASPRGEEAASPAAATTHAPGPAIALLTVGERPVTAPPPSAPTDTAAPAVTIARPRAAAAPTVTRAPAPVEPGAAQSPPAPPTAEPAPPPAQQTPPPASAPPPPPDQPSPLPVPLPLPAVPTPSLPAV
jgi:hypothetical protein